jgi:FKBP-type peptidyl-prolyl cis-trans isomerase
MPRRVADKTVRTALFFAIGFLVGCSRSNEGHPPTNVDIAATAQATNAERAAVFGVDANDSAIAWSDNGLGLKIADAGKGRKPGLGDIVRIRYAGRLKDGTVFDRADKPADFQIGRTIPGLSTGLQALGAGGKATLYIPPKLGYGPNKVAGIPPNSGLVFDVEVVAVNP